MTEKTSELLNRAADEIQKYGWTTGPRGWYRDKNAGLCLEGGILAAMGLTYDEMSMLEFWACPAYNAVADYLRLPEDWELYAWNDGSVVSPHAGVATAEKVIEVLRGAAMVEEAKERAAEVAAANA